MPAVPGKKGFFVSSPMLGAMVFLIAALIAVTLTTENDARIEITRSSEVQSKLQFISEAILADSYDVLLQTNLEYLTKDFLENEYFDINTGELWDTGVKGNLEAHYVQNLGETLGLDMRAYTLAYSSMPGIDRCDIEQVSTYISWPSVLDSDQDDGTIMVQASSFGERIVCESRDPKGKITVDIRGRPYRINVRIPNLYDAAREVLSLAKGALNSGVPGIEEPVASWTGPRWYIVKKTDNTLVDNLNTDLDNLIDKWESLMDWMSSRIISTSNGIFRDDGRLGLSLNEFEIDDERGDGYEITDFEISCVEDGVGEFRNCMPFRTQIVLGDSDCEYGEVPENSDNPFYSLRSATFKCDTSVCPANMRDVMNEVVKPLGSVCIDYFAVADTVYPVCKKWEAKAKSVVYKGVLSDDDQNYVLVGENETLFRFKDQQPNVVVNDLEANRLKCDEGGLDGDRYTDNVRRLLEKMQLKVGVGQEAGSTVQRWLDKGSLLTSLNDVYLIDIYKTIYGQGVLPIPCFRNGAKGRNECHTEDSQGNPKVEIDVDWSETRANCIDRMEDICQGYCSGISKPEFTDTFCRSLFPEPGKIAGGKGTMHCVCNGVETVVDVSVDSLSIGL